VTYDLSVPNSSGIDLATARVLRHGGPASDDLAYRGQLYALIGGVVVAAGQVEAAMKRVLLVATSDSRQVADAEKPWSGLEKDLQKVVDSGHAMADALSSHLAWAQEKQAKRRRDDVVHAYWCNFAGCGVRRARFYLDGRSATIVGGLEDLSVLVEDINVLATLARMLDDLAEPFWPQVRLPALGGKGAQTSSKHDTCPAG